MFLELPWHGFVLSCAAECRGQGSTDAGFLAPSTAIGPIFIARMGGNVELAGFANSITIVLSIILMTLFFTFLHI